MSKRGAGQSLAELEYRYLRTKSVTLFGITTRIKCREEAAMTKAKWIDGASVATLVITLILFLTAFFQKGFSHDLSLEAGVFLVSVKLVLGTYKNEILIRNLDQKLERLLSAK